MRSNRLLIKLEDGPKGWGGVWASPSENKVHYYCTGVYNPKRARQEWDAIVARVAQGDGTPDEELAVNEVTKRALLGAEFTTE